MTPRQVPGHKLLLNDGWMCQCGMRIAGASVTRTPARKLMQAHRAAVTDALNAAPPVVGPLVWRNIIVTPGCWLWTATTNRGYAQAEIRSKKHYVHRLIFEDKYGAVPEGYQLDHLCRIRHCVNPFHLEVVTQSENMRRSAMGFALTGRCRSGLHDMTDALNVAVRSDGERSCRPCRHIQRSRKKEQV